LTVNYRPHRVASPRRGDSMPLVVLLLALDGYSLAARRRSASSRTAGISAVAAP